MIIRFPKDLDLKIFTSSLRRVKRSGDAQFAIPQSVVTAARSNKSETLDLQPILFVLVETVSTMSCLLAICLLKGKMEAVVAFVSSNLQVMPF